MNYLLTSISLITEGKTICRTLRQSGFPLFHDAELLKPVGRYVWCDRLREYTSRLWHDLGEEDIDLRFDKEIATLKIKTISNKGTILIPPMLFTQIPSSGIF